MDSAERELREHHLRIVEYQIKEAHHMLHRYPDENSIGFKKYNRGQELFVDEAIRLREELNLPAVDYPVCEQCQEQKEFEKNRQLLIQ